jgi:hypothetical protein
MTKKLTLFALAAACTAMLALPSVASAGSWTLDRGGSDQTFTLVGGTLQFTAETIPGGSTLTVKCTSTTGTGKYTTATTGEMFWFLHGCTGPLGVACTSSGHTSGTITATGHLTNVFLSAGRTTPGVTITGPGGSTSTSISTFSCFGVTTTLSGAMNGHLEGGCDEAPRTTFSLEFASTETHGTSKWRYVTGNEGLAPDDLAAVTSGTHRRASFDATTTLHFAQASEVTCGVE